MLTPVAVSCNSTSLKGSRIEKLSCNRHQGKTSCKKNVVIISNMEIPVVPEIVENRPARILQQPFVFIIALNIHRIFTILRIKIIPNL